MTAMSNYLEKALCDHTLGLAAYTMPTIAWLGLSASDPGETGSFAGEPVGSGYARQDLTTATMGATNSTTGVSTNSVSAITFGPCTGSNWGTMSHVHVDDDDEGGPGNCLLFGALSTSRSISVTDSFVFATSTFSITFA